MGMPLPLMTMGDFLVWEAEQPERYEFYRGETFAMVGGTLRHNRVILNLAGRIADHLDGTACQVFAEGVKVQLEDAVLYPDVMVTCGTGYSGSDQAITDPSLVIEVLSPSTSGYDKRDKFLLYRSLPSLREYVLIDPVDRRVEVFTLTPAGWLLTDQTTADTMTLTSIDLTLPMAQVFKGVEQPAA